MLLEQRPALGRRLCLHDGARGGRRNAFGGFRASRFCGGLGINGGALLAGGHGCGHLVDRRMITPLLLGIGGRCFTLRIEVQVGHLQGKDEAVALFRSSEMPAIQQRTPIPHFEISPNGAVLHEKALSGGKRLAVSHKRRGNATGEIDLHGPLRGNSHLGKHLFGGNEAVRSKLRQRLGIHIGGYKLSHPCGVRLLGRPLIVTILLRGESLAALSKRCRLIVHLIGVGRECRGVEHHESQQKRKTHREHFRPRLRGEAVHRRRIIAHTRMPMGS